MTAIIFLFDLVHLDDLFCDEYVDDFVKEVVVKGVLKFSIFVVQKILWIGPWVSRMD